jgi:hypothetical protein
VQEDRDRGGVKGGGVSFILPLLLFAHCSPCDKHRGTARCWI